MRRTSLGFSLVELMITLAIVGILAAMAIPSFKDMLNQSRAMGFANELSSSLNLARSEAIKRGAPVTVCTSDATATSPVCATGRNWQDGWLVFVDKGTPGTFDSTTDIRLKVGQPTNLNIQVTPNTTNTGYVIYDSLGNSSGNQTLVICVGGVSGQTVGVQRTISINTSGRVSITRGAC